jgi:CrcB protein
MGPGNGFCLRSRVNRPILGANDSYRIPDFIMLTRYIMVALGGALGSVLRFFLSSYCNVQMGGIFPWGIMIVNITGSFAIGFIFTLTQPDGRWFANPATRDFLMIGICGGYTTFSSFSLNTLNLARDGEWLRAGGNIVGSVVFCLVAVWLGHVAAATINQMKGQ